VSDQGIDMGIEFNDDVHEATNRKGVSSTEVRQLLHATEEGRHGNLHD
jgi:hypothetical protein